MYLLAALVIAGWVAVFVSLRRTMTSAASQLRTELRLEFQRQIDSLSAKVRVLEQTLEQTIEAQTAAGEVDPAQAPANVRRATNEITPETFAKISETIATLLGRKVEIRSVRILRTPAASVNAWAQHGRVVIQASHDLAQRGRE